MNISTYLTAFAERKSNRYKPYSKIYRQILLGGKPYSLNAQEGFEESGYLYLTIRSCVQRYSSNKDTAILLFKDLAAYLTERGVNVPEIHWPPIPVSNTFERLMFMAKYLQEENHKISDLPDLLWISGRQVEDDLSRLRGLVDPIQVCGKKFFIEACERHGGRITFESTAHPIFLAENLTQILIMLKGLKQMSADPLFSTYAMETAREIWRQLSGYARRRLRFVLKELMPEDFAWYDSLANEETDLADETRNYFHTEETISRRGHFAGTSVVLECIKNERHFCVEYADEDGAHLYKDCVFEPGSYEGNGITVTCASGKKHLLFGKILRSAYTMEELISF